MRSCEVDLGTNFDMKSSYMVAERQFMAAERVLNISDVLLSGLLMNLFIYHQDINEYLLIACVILI